MESPVLDNQTPEPRSDNDTPSAENLQNVDTYAPIPWFLKGEMRKTTVPPRRRMSQLRSIVGAPATWSLEAEDPNSLPTGWTHLYPPTPPSAPLPARVINKPKPVKEATPDDPTAKTKRRRAAFNSNMYSAEEMKFIADYSSWMYNFYPNVDFNAYTIELQKNMPHRSLNGLRCWLSKDSHIEEVKALGYRHEELKCNMWKRIQKTRNALGMTEPNTEETPVVYAQPDYASEPNIETEVDEDSSSEEEIPTIRRETPAKVRPQPDVVIARQPPGRPQYFYSWEPVRESPHPQQVFVGPPISEGLRRKEVSTRPSTVEPPRPQQESMTRPDNSPRQLVFPDGTLPKWVFGPEAIPVDPRLHQIFPRQPIPARGRLQQVFRRKDTPESEDDESSRPQQILANEPILEVPRTQKDFERQPTRDSGRSEQRFGSQPMHHRSGPQQAVATPPAPTGSRPQPVHATQPIGRPQQSSVTQRILERPRPETVFAKRPTFELPLPTRERFFPTSKSPRPEQAIPRVPTLQPTRPQPAFAGHPVSADFRSQEAVVAQHTPDSSRPEQVLSRPPTFEPRLHQASVTRPAHDGTRPQLVIVTQPVPGNRPPQQVSARQPLPERKLPQQVFIRKDTPESEDDQGPSSDSSADENTKTLGVMRGNLMNRGRIRGRGRGAARARASRVTGMARGGHETANDDSLESEDDQETITARYTGA